MLTQAVTNLIIALAVTTTTQIPAPCPDNLPGCLVQHYRAKTTTQYLPALAPECGNGLAYNFFDLRKELIASYGSMNDIPNIIPIYLYIKTENGTSYPLKNHPTGFINKEALLVIDCKYPQDTAQYINTHYTRSIQSSPDSYTSPTNPMPIHVPPTPTTTPTTTP